MDIKKELEKISGLLADARNKLDEVGSELDGEVENLDYDVTDWTNSIENVETEIDTYLEDK
tara:strand:+ start:1272 stop:1454 length:183 start_codon:yes stop_codon:yes gene_type:complete